MAEFRIRSGAVTLAGEEAGEGPAVVLLHGLTATRRYVVMGSRALERSGHRVIGFDARGHGESSAAGGPGDYGYEALADDLEAVLDELGVGQAVLAGVSMGAHTALALALHAPERVGGLVVITPGYEPGGERDPARLARWDALAEGLRGGGIEGFLAAYEPPAVAPALRETVVSVIRQRLARHRSLEAVADALQGVPRSRPFERLSNLAGVSVPTVVIASGDEADPEHPQRLAEAYAAQIPGATLLLDEPGRSPRAWQASQVSRVIAEVASAAAGA